MSKYKWLMSKVDDTVWVYYCVDTGRIVRTITLNDNLLWCYGEARFVHREHAQKYVEDLQEAEDQERKRLDESFAQERAESEFNRKFEQKFAEITGALPKYFDRSAYGLGKNMQKPERVVEIPNQQVKLRMGCYTILFGGCLVTCLLLAIYVGIYVK